MESTDCAACGKPITEDQHEDRHTEIDHKAGCNFVECGCPTLEYHPACCPECKEAEKPLERPSNDLLLAYALRRLDMPRDELEVLFWGDYPEQQEWSWLLKAVEE
jgi:hypothetical protein